MLRPTTSHFFWVGLLVLAFAVSIAVGEPLGILEVKGRSYRKVTLTSFDGGYITISHSSGIKSIPVKDLSTEQIESLNKTSSSVKIDPEKIRQALAKPSGRLIKEVEQWLSGLGGLNHRSQGGVTPLIRAASEGRADYVRVLIMKGADLDEVDDAGRSAWTEASLLDHDDVIELLRQAGAKPPDLFAAARAGDAGTVLNGLKGNPKNINLADEQGITLLMHAARAGSVEMMTLLLEKGAALDARDRAGRNALWHAVKGGKKTAVELLISKKLDVNHLDLEGRSALMEAARSKNIEILRIILEHGGNTKARDRKDGWTPLMYAVSAGNGEGVRLLIQNNSDLEAFDREGKTALDMARKSGATEIVDILKSAGKEQARGKEERGRSFKRVFVGELAKQKEQEARIASLPSYVPIVMWCGLVVAVIAQLGLVVQAFRASWLWGFIVLLLGPVGGLCFCLGWAKEGFGMLGFVVVGTLAVWLFAMLFQLNVVEFFL